MKKLLIISSLVLVALTGCKKEQTINLNPLKPHDVISSTWNPKIKVTLVDTVWNASQTKVTILLHIANMTEMNKKYGTLNSMSVTTTPTFTTCAQKYSIKNWFGGTYSSATCNTTTNQIEFVYVFTNSTEYVHAHSSSCKKLSFGVVAISGSKGSGSTVMFPNMF